MFFCKKLLKKKRDLKKIVIEQLWLGQVFATFFYSFLNIQYVDQCLSCLQEFYIATFSIFTCNCLLQFLSSIAQNVKV